VAAWRRHQWRRRNQHRNQRIKSKSENLSVARSRHQAKPKNVGERIVTMKRQVMKKATKKVT